MELFGHKSEQIPGPTEVMNDVPGVDIWGIPGPHPTPMKGYLL